MVRRRPCRWLALPLGFALLPGCLHPDGDTRSPGMDPKHEVHAVQAKELPPDQAVILCMTAAEEMEKHGYEAEAIAQYEKARQLSPQHAHVARRLAVLYDRQGDNVHALAEYDQALKAEPHDPDLLNDRGYFHYERGDLENAEKWLRKALEADPHHQRATINLALTVARQGRLEESEQLFGRVLPPAQAAHNLGILLTQQGRVAEARACFQRALQLDPNLTQSRAVLDRLDKPEAPQASASDAQPPAPAKPAPIREVRESLLRDSARERTPAPATERVEGTSPYAPLSR